MFVGKFAINYNNAKCVRPVYRAEDGRLYIKLLGGYRAYINTWGEATATLERKGHLA